MERLFTERAITLGFALDRSTATSYSSALNSYLRFCQIHGLTPEPTSDSLSLYITYISQYIEPRSVRAYLSGITTELEPYYPRVREIRQSPLVVRTMKGALRRFSRPLQSKLPLTREDLQLVVTQLPRPLAHDDLLFLSILLSGFFGLMRLGELVQPDNPHLRSLSRLTWRHSVLLVQDRYEFSLPRSKSDSLFEGDRIIIQKSQLQPDPHGFFASYLLSRDLLFHARPHLWIRADGTIPIRGWFIRRLRSFFPRTFGGHSMRAGGATSLAAAGVPPSQIQAIGRWKSATFERYIRKHPTLLQAFLFHGRAVHDPPFAQPP